MDGSSQPSQPETAGLISRATTWARQNVPEMLVSAAIGFAVAWLINIYFVAVRYEGTQILPHQRGGPAVVAGNRVTGTVFWVVGATLILTVVSYGRRVGWGRLGAELQAAPKNLGKAWHAGDKLAQWALLAWGAAMSLLVALLFGAAAAGISGVALLVLAASPLVVLVGRAVRSLGTAVLGRIAGDDAARLSDGTAVASVFGAALGLVIAWLLDATLLKLVAAVVAAALAVAILKQRESPPNPAAVILLLAVGAWVMREFGADMAWADDGGWQEGGGSLGSWLGSPGSGRVIVESTAGGVAGGAGAAMGSALGSGLAGMSGDAGLGGLSGEWGASEAGVSPEAPTADTAGTSGLSGDWDGGEEPPGGGPPAEQGGDGDPDQRGLGGQDKRRNPEDDT